jgi:hypothetical protein
MDITRIPTYELKEDRAASVLDMRTCAKLAVLSSGEQRDKLQWRVDGNERIIAAIDAELARRGESNH